MVRLVIYLLAIALVAAGLGWLADRPGTLQIAWQGYDIETSVFRAVVILAATIATAVFLWSVVKAIWNSPAAMGQRIVRRRQKRGLDALSSGLIAASAGDGALASRFAQLARKSLPHEPLTQLLRAQAAQLSGDRGTARRIYEAMLSSPETEQLGLRGLYLEAKHEGAGEAALQYADRALKANPKLGWSSDALFGLQCKQHDWAGALETLAGAKRGGQIAKADGDRKRAVLLTARAIELEDGDPDKALQLAVEAHTLAPELVPAATVAGRILAARGQTAKAAKVLQKTWARSPHPDLAYTYAYARVGDSTRDRLDRIRQLAALSPHSIESPIAVATTAIEARLFEEARAALAPLIPDRTTQRVATLMARIEAGENGAQGRVREWLARAATCARDPMWVADGIISDRWEPVSADGRLDAFEWRVPVEAKDATRAEIDANRLEELLAISARDDDDVVTAAVVTTDTSATRVEAEEASIAPAADVPADEASEAPDAADTGEVVADDRPAVPANKSNGSSERRSSDEIVSPRPPDDPGTDDQDTVAEQPYARRSYRAVS